MKTFKVAVLAGDGIGPEIMKQGLKVLHVIEEKRPVKFELLPALFGACAYFDSGNAFPR